MHLDLLEIENLCNALSRGHTVLMPTDTIWGISCDAHNQSAVKRVSEIKNRSEKKKYILLVSSIEMLKRYASDIHPRIETLLSFHKKPTTCIYKAKTNVPDYLISHDGTIAIRLVREATTAVLIEKFGKAIISTSANTSSDKFPTSFDEISVTLKQEIDFIPNVQQKYKETLMDKPSVIIKFDHDGELIFLRS